MKATLEFNLPEDQGEHLAAIKGPERRIALLELDNQLRSWLKHDHPFGTNVRRALEATREKLNEFAGDLYEYYLRESEAIEKWITQAEDPCPKCGATERATSGLDDHCARCGHAFCLDGAEQPEPASLPDEQVGKLYDRIHNLHSRIDQVCDRLDKLEGGSRK